MSTTGRQSIAFGPAPQHRRALDEENDLQGLLGVDECIRYYPPDLAPATDPAVVFRSQSPTLERREIDLFVDVPYCKTICGFCPFNVYPYEEGSARSYLRALQGEIEEVNARHDLSAATIATVWIGGGTPAVLEEGLLEALLGMLHEGFDLTEARELTVEIKPSRHDLSEAKLALLQRFGIPRISMGIQSSSPAFLRMLGRGHTAEEAFDVVRLVKDAGFALNVDMMYRLPGQTLAQVDADADAVAALGVDHISWFPYVPHAGTTLANRLAQRRISPQPGRDDYFTMFAGLVEQMRGAGFEQYTPYHFAGTNRCEYHVGRWGLPQRETLGLGPGAFAFFNGWIYTNEHDPAAYERAVRGHRPPVMMAKQLTRTEMITRLAVLGIKLFNLDAATFEVSSGVPLTSYYEAELAFLEKAGLMTVSGGGAACTFLGRAFNNDIAIVLGTDTARRTPHPQATDLMRPGR